MAKTFINTVDDADNRVTLEINNYNSTYTLTIQGKTVETGTFEKLAKRLATSKDEIGNLGGKRKDENDRLIREGIRHKSKG